MNRTKISPRRREQLRAMGLDPNDAGRIVNRASGTTTLPPIPKNSEELAEFFGDTGQYKAVLGDKNTLQAFVSAYAEQQQGAGTDLQRLVEVETQKALVAFLKDNDTKSDKDTIRRLNLDPQTRPLGMKTSHRQGTAYNAQAPGAVLDKEFGSGAEFFKAAWHLNPDEGTRSKMVALRNSYSSVVPADGGFLVPEALRSQLLEVALEQSVVRPRATVIPMEVARVSLPMIDSTSNVSSVFGGMIAYWGEESAALTDASMKFAKVTLDAKKLTGLSIVPNELLTDSLASFAALIETKWPEALAFYEDAAYMTGTGAGEPLGFIGAGNDAGIAITKESGQAASTIVWENIVKMYARMLPGSLNRAVWLASPDTFPELATMALSVGTGGSAVWLNNGAVGAPVSILGRPVIFTEKVSALGTRGDLAFVDLGYYLIGDRQTMTAASSTDWKFGNDQTAYRILQRVDGRPWIQSAITPKNGGATLSPFVEIQTRA